MARKHVEEFVLKMLDRLTGSKANSDQYRVYFKSMSNTQFKKWIEDLHSGKTKLGVTIPNGGKEKVSIEVITKMAKEIGHDMFDYIISESTDGEITQSQVKACILELPCRRVSQLLDKGLSISDHDGATDKLTGQPIGVSRAASMSNVETDVMVSVGMIEGSKELIKVRGGDVGAYGAYKSIMLATGKVELGEVYRYSTGVSSLKTMSIYLKSKMIGNNL